MRVDRLLLEEIFQLLPQPTPKPEARAQTSPSNENSNLSLPNKTYIGSISNFFVCE